KPVVAGADTLLHSRSECAVASFLRWVGDCHSQHSRVALVSKNNRRELFTGLSIAAELKCLSAHDALGWLHFAVGPAHRHLGILRSTPTPVKLAANSQVVIARFHRPSGGPNNQRLMNSGLDIASQ